MAAGRGAMASFVDVEGAPWVGSPFAGIVRKVRADLPSIPSFLEQTLPVPMSIGVGIGIGGSLGGVPIGTHFNLSHSEAHCTLSR